MLALRLELSFYRQFEHIEIYFPQKGLIGFRGVNGAGKSTIFNSIDWILFGKYKGVNQNQLKQHKSPKNASTYGILDFVLNGDFYRVRRDLANSLSKNFVQKNKNTVAEGTTNVNNYIQNLFRMDQEAFRVCYYASQGDFDALAQMKDAPRAAMVSKLLGIEKIDETAKQTRDDKKVIEIEISEAKKHLKDENLLKESLAQYKEQEKTFKQQLKTIEKEIKGFEKQRENLSESKIKSDKLHETYLKLSSEIANLETKRNTLAEHSLKNAEQQLLILESQQKRLSEIEDKKELYFSLLQKKDDLNEAKEQFIAVHRIKKQIQDTYKNISYYEQTIEESSSKLSVYDEIETKIKTIELQISQLEETLAIARDSGKEIQTMLNVNKKVYQEILHDKGQFEELGEDVPCPTCKRPLGEHFGNQLNHLEQKRQDIIKETAQMKLQLDSIVSKGKKDKATLDKLKEELSYLHSKFREKSGVLAKRDTSSQEKNKQLTILIDLKNQRNYFPEQVTFDAEAYKILIEEIKSLVPIYEEIIKLQNQVESIPKEKERIEDIKQQINETNIHISKLETERDKLNFNKEVHLKLSQEIEEIRSQIDKSKDNRYTIQSQLDDCSKSIDAIGVDLKNNQEQKELLKDKQQEIVDLAKLDELYKAYKQNKLSELAPILSDKMSDMIEIVTDGLYDRIELDDKYNINIYTNGEKYPLEIFSGGEQKLAALLQRIAVSQLLVEQTSQTNFDMIALDEVTSAFDENRQDSMLDMLRSLNEMFKQILIVSHNEHVKDSFDHTLIIERSPAKKSTAFWALTESGTPTFDTEEIKNIIRTYIESDEDLEQSN